MWEENETPTWPASAVRQQLLEQHRRMQCLPAGKMLNLQAAGESRGDDNRTWLSRTDRGKRPLFADEPGDLIVLLFVTERSRHATASGIEVDDLRAGNAPKQPQRR